MDAKDLNNAVQAIARREGKTPMKYREEADEIVIVWENGEKNRYAMDAVTPTIAEVKPAQTRNPETHRGSKGSKPK